MHKPSSYKWTTGYRASTRTELKRKKSHGDLQQWCSSCTAQLGETNLFPVPSSFWPNGYVCSCYCYCCSNLHQSEEEKNRNNKKMPHPSSSNRRLQHRERIARYLRKSFSFERLFSDCRTCATNIDRQRWTSHLKCKHRITKQATTPVTTPGMMMKVMNVCIYVCNVVAMAAY